MASTYSIVLLLLGMMMVTTVVGAGESNMFGYSDYKTTDLEDDWFEQPRAIIMGGKRRRFGRPPPTLDPEENSSELGFSPLKFL
ncbi:hypothetical protein MtrunA17_Chr7g0236441 [Medicago truncatula]|uniref:Leguminosin group567 LEED...PEED secreted peptide n=1 Tax=Medicago truncatula TaxID=3880 RepID=A0A072U0P4_MEDTR|nr:leguminosin group567 LEED...PEED secreted peptide [Medicago truncatula]RHN45898.1 hypothetical protein MtrunA17_Chr7g0236441 [Medicago truncatula]